MRAHSIVPVKGLGDIKSRLSPLLGLRQRRELSFCMLEDVLKAIMASRRIEVVVVVSPDSKLLELAGRLGAQAIKERDEMGVNVAVARASRLCLKRGAVSTVVLPSDIPLISPMDIDAMVQMGSRPGSVVIAPSLRLDGTNALLRNPPDAIRANYERDSFNSHLKEASAKGLSLKVYLSRGVQLDLDSPEDITEFVKGEGNTLTHGFLNSLISAGSIAL